MHIEEIQAALREERLDGWLFFDHHQRDLLAYRILKLKVEAVATRRWYYFIPAHGEPKGLVHSVESHVLDGLPGAIRQYSSWTTQTEGIRDLVAGARKIAMQYSPNCAIPYVSLVDGGTLELVRAAGVEIVTSANLVQLFDARWTAEQLELHLEAGRRVDRVRAQAFQKIAAALASGQTITEWDINRFIRSGFESAGMVTDHGPIVAVNAHMSDPHYEPEAQGSSPIQRGDAVLIDMWAKLARPSAVYYDITWTGYCGATPPSELQNVFEVVRGARDSAVQRIRTAVERGETIQGFQVDDAARTYIKDRGFGDKFVHRTGHSIGEEVHGTGANMDNLETHDERRIIAQTCFSVEPGVYLDKFGIRSEVNVYVGPKEARVTGEAQQQLVTIE
ncbi:MAG TPA: M24 family metallopeptidase [Candidatus Binataceae bacterium]|nr:M24 family metallopeptidase [Candidatus Binataceae bacterium]